MGVVGIFGGTFDPPHLGHLAAAQEALDVAGLDRVLFVPSQQNPLKQDGASSSVEHRLAMTALAVADDPRFELSRADIDRPGPSYTVDLLQGLKQALGPGQELAFIAGMDVLYELHRWRDPLRLLDLARLLVIQRPGQETLLPEEVDRRIPGASRRITVILTPGVAISATELRERVAAGRPIRYLVPDAVADYIREHRLYVAGERTSCWQVSGDPLLRRVCEETLEWVLREMRGPEGGFFSALDADSEGVEGRYYVWTESQIREALGSETLAEAAIAFFGVTDL